MNWTWVILEYFHIMQSKPMQNDFCTIWTHVKQFTSLPCLFSFLALHFLKTRLCFHDDDESTFVRVHWNAFHGTEFPFLLHHHHACMRWDFVIFFKPFLSPLSWKRNAIKCCTRGKCAALPCTGFGKYDDDDDDQSGCVVYLSHDRQTWCGYDGHIQHIILLHQRMA